MSVVTSIEINNSNIVFTFWKVSHHSCSSVALDHRWSSGNSFESFGVQHESIALWSNIILATWWEHSRRPLSALNNNILFLIVYHLEPSISLTWTAVSRWITFCVVYDPIFSPVSSESLCVINSPLIKRNVENSVSSLFKFGLFFPFGSPEITIGRPCTCVLIFTPWVSHLDKLMNAISGRIFEADTFKNTISMTSYKTVMANLTSSSHWISSCSSWFNNFPKFIISHIFTTVLRYRHTCQCSECFTWVARVKSGVVNV